MDRKVLIADDNQLNIRLLEDILADESFIVYKADNGFPVLEMARELKPDVILMDIMMPDMDGFTVCKLLKRDPDVNNIPIIMVTAKTDGNDLKCALDSGAFDYIKKPVDELEVIARVQSAIRFKDQQDQLRESATKDSLTGLFNHALLMELLEKGLSKQQRNAGEIAFVMMDIDYFKVVNDTYGHMAGDLVLKELSDILMYSVRQGDITGRYGGEEFGVIITNAEKEAVYSLCERIRKKVEDHDFVIDNKTIKITISMGIHFKSAQEEITAAGMVRKADEALYRAKHSGRNRVAMND